MPPEDRQRLPGIYAPGGTGVILAGVPGELGKIELRGRLKAGDPHDLIRVMPAEGGLMTTSLKQDLEASHWGIDPIPDEHRKLSGFDLAVLWGDLGIGLLVIVTGMFLVASPEVGGFGMSLRAALASILLGSVIGCLMLAAVGVIGTHSARPTMTLLRPVLGRKGSWIPSILNVTQLLGWTAFELWAMALVADSLGKRLFGFSSFHMWLLAFSVIVLGLSLWGPLGVVRVWMERFGIWVVAGIGLFITIYLVANVELGKLWSAGGSGGALILGVPLDLVIVMPVSWLPLVADYNRFSRSPRGSFVGTFTGYFLANVWFYGLGALLIFGLKASPDPAGVASAILSIGGIAATGILLLAGLLVGETDEAFADVYSAAVSLRNIAPRISSRFLVVGAVTIGAAVAAILGARSDNGRLQYEFFLLLLGSVFVPLFGVWFADHYLLRNRETPESPFRFASLVPWVAGFAVYHWIAPTGLAPWAAVARSVFGDSLSSKFTWLNASLPSFLVAFVLHAIIGVVARRLRSSANAVSS